MKASSSSSRHQRDTESVSDADSHVAADLTPSAAPAPHEGFANPREQYVVSEEQWQESHEQFLPDDEQYIKQTPHGSNVHPAGDLRVGWRADCQAPDWRVDPGSTQRQTASAEWSFQELSDVDVVAAKALPMPCLIILADDLLT